MEVSVFRFQLCFFFLTPETFKYGVWSLGFHKFAVLQHSSTPILQGPKQTGLPPHLELRYIRTQ